MDVFGCGGTSAMYWIVRDIAPYVMVAVDVLAYMQHEVHIACLLPTIISSVSQIKFRSTVFTPCVAFGTKTHSSVSAPRRRATAARASVSLGITVWRINRSGLLSISSESSAIAEDTGRGSGPYEPKKYRC